VSPSARRRNLIVNIERMRRVDQLAAEGWHVAEVRSRPGEFVPRADVYYCEGPIEEGGPSLPKAVVVVDLAGVTPDAVNLEVSGRILSISGSRPVRETEGRAFQQVEIPTGAFRRTIELGVDVDPALAKASYEDGLLRVELPFELRDRSPQSVPVERAPR
jgi:HSP20 family protein